MGALVTLCMIVKNEEAIIARCLTVNRRHYDRCVIVDTGSTDRTEEEVEKTLADVPHVFAKREWRGFGPGKTDALQLAVEHFGTNHYALVLDADEILDGEIPDSPLDCGRYTIDVRLSDHLWTPTARFFHLEGEWRYLGVLHEIPWSPRPHSEGRLPLVLHSPRDGARSQNPDKYAGDAALLERAITSLESAPPGDADGIPAALRDGFLTRYRFYLAQSYRDAGNHLEAVKNYRHRATMGPGLNWEEIYISHLEAGRALSRLGRHHESQQSFLAAHHAYADRAEAIRELAVRFNDARRQKDESPPAGSLFVELAPEQPRSHQPILDPLRALRRPLQSPDPQSVSVLEQWISRQDDRRPWISIDKWKHYLPIYERHIPRTIRDRPVRLLEIGIQGGGSLAMWRYWLGETAIIHGLDIDPTCANRGIASQAVVHIGSQANRDLLDEIVAAMNGATEAESIDPLTANASAEGGIDVVVDDGSHLSSDQWTSFETLFPQLAVGGVYVCEDVHTSYWDAPPFDGGLRRPGTFVERIKELIDRLHADYVANPNATDPGFAAEIGGIHIYDSIVVIEKCARKTPAVRIVVL